MKVQSLAVIFAIIILPIVIIISFYIQGEVDTIALQTSYDTKLIDSTHDAMVAFEINTANEDLSSVADSLRSIIDASCNVFLNTLATNLGISNAGNVAVDSYVPALLYTLYDGYYIYAPTRTPQVLTYESDTVVYVGDRGVTFKEAKSYTNANGESVTIGVYTFDKDEYAKEKDDNDANNESEDAKKARYDVLLPYSLQYEYGQMLFKNKDGTYSTQAHTSKDPVDTDTEYHQDHILKSFMPYSARYQRDNIDVTLNYTLDNYLTVEGDINGVYYSKTGYLISKDTVSGIILRKGSGEDSVEITDILSYNEGVAENMILSGEYDIELQLKPILEDNTKLESGLTISYTKQYDEEGNLYSFSKAKERLIRLQEMIVEDADQDGTPDRSEDEINDLQTKLQDLEYAMECLSAINYYVRAQIFSDWVYNNLSEIRACDISDDILEINKRNYTTYKEDGEYVEYTDADDNSDKYGVEIFHRFEEDETRIFGQLADGSDQNPELEDSPFFTHKIEVIRNNIQYNLNLAMSAYNQMLQMTNIQMPVISDKEWEQILTRVSVTAFMQGLQCGMKTYNNYAIASSTNNELTVIPTEIYYTLKNEFNTANITHEYHKVDCYDLQTPDDDNTQYISFKSKEIKYDKIYDKASKKYMYDHRNLGCYRCAITSNYLKDVGRDDSGDIIQGYSDDVKVSVLPTAKQRAYYIAVGKERHNLYKTNALTDSNGYEVLLQEEAGIDVSFAGGGDSKSSPPIMSGATSKRPISEVREIEITLKDLSCTNKSAATVNFRLLLNGHVVNENIVLNLEQATPQTIVAPVHLNESAAINQIELEKVYLDDPVTCKKLNVRVVYE